MNGADALDQRVNRLPKVTPIRASESSTSRASFCSVERCHPSSRPMLAAEPARGTAVENGRFCSRPRIVAAGGDVPGARHMAAIEAARCALTKSEPLDGTAFVSRANQARGFERISRSSLSCLFSLRSRHSSMRSALLRPPLRRPSYSNGLRDPGCGSARRWLKLFRQVFRRAAGANQFDRLPPTQRVWGRFFDIADS